MLVWIYKDLSKTTFNHQERGSVEFGSTNGDFYSNGLEIEICGKNLDELAKVEAIPAL